MNRDIFFNIKNNSTAEEATNIYIGFSGGADSTALLLALSHFYAEKLRIIHFHHGLRDTSDHEASWCQSFATRLKLEDKFEIIRLNVPQNRESGESIEEAARNLRLKYWKKLITGKDLVALGHHHNDVIENFFIRLMRGSNSSGLTSLRQFSKLGELTI